MKTIDKILWGVAIFAGLITLCMFASVGQKRSEIASVREEIQKIKEDDKPLAMIENLYNTFGKGTSSYHAGVPIVVLSRGGVKRNIPVYWAKEGTIYAKCLSDEISGEWEKKWDKSWTNYTVSSGNTRGCYQVAFTNDVDRDSFNVIVVVK